MPPVPLTRSVILTDRDLIRVRWSVCMTGEVSPFGVFEPEPYTRSSTELWNESQGGDRIFGENTSLRAMVSSYAEPAPIEMLVRYLAQRVVDGFGLQGRLC